jgi:acetyltransferase
LAILPYPARHEQIWPMRGGSQYTVRAIHPGDAAMLQNLVQRLSPRSRYFRFVSAMTELPPPMLARFTLIDYDREMALVAVTRDRGGDGAADERIVGVSRYVINPDGTSCEFALLVDDAFNHRGVGSRLMESLMDVAREKGLAEIVGLVLFDNVPMLALMRHLGFTLRHFTDDPSFVRVSHAL